MRFPGDLGKAPATGVCLLSLSLSGISGYLISQISQDLSQAAFPTLIYFTNVKHYGFPGASPGLPPSLNKSATFVLL